MSSRSEATRVPGVSEQEPLLGAPGDASQVEGRALWYNLLLGTASVAQIGAWVLFAIVWGAVFSNDLILFSAHPLLNSSAILLYIQAILLLQPTHTQAQKINGTYAHSALSILALGAAIAGLVVIEYNKIAHKGEHFVSAHAILGLTTYIVVALQHVIGFAQFFTPAVFGGVANAKKLYKYHRVSGYVVLVLLLATVSTATLTDYNVNVLHMKLWAVVVSAVIVVVGVGARVRLSKFGWLAGKAS